MKDRRAGIVDRARARWQQLLGTPDSDGLRRRLVTGAAGSYGLNVLNTALVLGYSLLLSNMLGAARYGSYTYAVTWVQLLVIFAGLGLDRLLIREVARCQTRSEWGLLRGLLRWSTGTGLLASLAVTAIGAGVALGVGMQSREVRVTLLVALAMLPLLILLRFRQAALQGLHKVVIGQLPEMLLRPVLFGVLIVAAWLAWGDELSPPRVAALNVAATAVALLLGLVLLRRSLPDAVRQAASRYEARLWLFSGFSLFLVSGVRVINAKIDTLMLGMLSGAEWVGIYSAANRAPTLITFCLLAVNAALAPAVARLYAEGDMARLQRVVTRSARAVLIASLLVGGVFIAFGYWFLLLFGSEFTQGHTALIILSLARILNASMGSVGILLVMTGHERDVAWAVALGALLNFALDLLLIPYLGMNGAALGSSASTLVWNVLLVWMVWKRLRINPTAFRRLR